MTTTGYPAATIASSDLPADVTLTDNGNGTATLSGYYLAGTHTFTLKAANGVIPNVRQTFTMKGTS